MLKFCGCKYPHDYLTTQYRLSVTFACNKISDLLLVLLVVLQLLIALLECLNLQHFIFSMHMGFQYLGRKINFKQSKGS